MEPMHHEGWRGVSKPASRLGARQLLTLYVFSVDKTYKAKSSGMDDATKKLFENFGESLQAPVSISASGTY
jgi:hypothetical protein